MANQKLQWQDCDIEEHAEGWCFMATTETGQVLRDCEDTK